jgi:lysine biosynthesis protein LysW
MSALCVECDAELNIVGRVRLGQRIVCPNCGVQLEVISTHPIEVDVAYDDSEEWDDFDGYGLDEEDEVDDLDELVRLEGVGGDLLDEFDDDFDDEFGDELDDEEFDDEFDEELDDDFSEEDEDLIGRA